MGKAERKDGNAVEACIEAGAFRHLSQFCLKRGLQSLRIVADSNTWAALGSQVKDEVEKAGIRAACTIFESDSSHPLAADAGSILRLLMDLSAEDQLLAAVGSGTITDITRFVASRSGRSFVSLPTAPSVDAYASVVAPLVVDGVKKTVGAKAPAAIFADTDVLCAAPRPMISAGFGDVVCKYCSVADWRLGALFWDEKFDEDIAARSVATAADAAAAAADIGAATPHGISVLIGALIESGRCMAEAGNSHPASGAEHQYSHFWEMKLLREGRPPVLHGLKVGVGAVLASELWEKVRGVPAAQAAKLLSASEAPSPGYERAAMQRAYGRDAPAIIGCQQRFLELEDSAPAYRDFCDKIAANWDKVLSIAAGVPSPADMRRLLKTAGCCTDASELGLGRAEIASAIEAAHYIRDRFTVRKLARMLWGD